MFCLSDDGVSAMKRLDVRPLWQAEFTNPSSGRILVDRALRHVETAFQNIDTEKTMFDAWLFTISVGTTARSLWGAENPWCNEEGFMEDFRYVIGMQFLSRILHVLICDKSLPKHLRISLPTAAQNHRK